MCYGRPNNIPIPINHPTAPFTSYGISKTAGESYLLQSDLPVVSLRLANICGPRLAIGPIPTFYQRLKENKDCFCSETVRDFLDISDYILLFPNKGLRSNLKNKEIYDIDFINKEITYKCFILINENKKCIEITFKNNKILQNECYIYESHTEKNKLLFNLNRINYPFIEIIPSSSPYLCYKKNNTYYLDFIMTSSFSNDLIGNKMKIIFNKENEDFEFFKIYTIKIAPSSIFPSIGSFLSIFLN